MKYKHSEEFYKKQYLKYRNTIKSQSLFDNFNHFKAAYQQAEARDQKMITKNFVYETEYEISYDTYKAERDMMKKIGKKVAKKELLGMTTTEFADKYSHEINVVYNSYRKQGKSTDEAKELISYYFFGSR